MEGGGCGGGEGVGVYGVENGVVGDAGVFVGEYGGGRRRK